MSLINTRVQPFKANAFVSRAGKGEFIEVTEQSLMGKWSVLIFMPAAFQRMTKWGEIMTLNVRSQPHLSHQQLQPISPA